MGDRGGGGFDRGRGRTRGFGSRGRGGGAGFRKAGPDDPRISSSVQIFVENLPADVRIPELSEFFSSVGEIKIDRLTKKPRIWLYHDKQTGEPTGECTITYNSTQTQQMALQTYDGQSFRSHTLRVTPSIVKAHMAKPPPRGFLRGRGGRGNRRDGRGGGRGRGGRGGGGGGPDRRYGQGSDRYSSYGGEGRSHSGGYGSYDSGDTGYGWGERGYGGSGDRGGFGGGGRYNPYPRVQ